MNRLTAKLVHGLARLAFWRKPVESIPEQPQSPEPETARRLRTTEAAPGANVDVPVMRTGWFARLKQVLRRRRDPAQEPSQDTDQTKVRVHSSQEQAEVTAAAGVVPQPKLSFLGRLKNTLRRQPNPEQLAVDADTSKPGAETVGKTSAPSNANPGDDAEAVQISLIRRVGAMLSSKWVWIPSVSIVLLAIIVAMLLMLLQSAQEKKQLQTKLIATQKKLEQTSISKQAAARKSAPRQANDPANETLGSAANTQLDADAGDCVVAGTESVIKNLKNCIDRFNNDMAQ